MFLIDEIEYLRFKIQKIDVPVDNLTLSNKFFFEKAVVETAFWARLILEVIEDLGVEKHGYTIKMAIPLTKSISDPKNPGCAKLIFSGEERSIKELLGAIIHFRYFFLAPYANGDCFLDVQSDFKDRCQFYLSDFIKSVKTFLIPKRLVVVGICDKTERTINKFSQGDPASSGTDFINNSFVIRHFHWLLEHSFLEKIPLKLEILERFFGISDVPDNIAARLSFFHSWIDNHGRIMLGFRPTWIESQKGKSATVDSRLLFDLIRKHHKAE